MEEKKIPYVEEEYDVVVVGAGHAGCEAALACARLGLETIIFTVSVDSIAMMPCNPNIGGSSKGHLVREIDALGGEMGKNIDKTFIQSKMLNKSDLSPVTTVEDIRKHLDKKMISISAKEQTGMDDLEETIKEMFFSGEVTFNDEVYITNIRHKTSLQEALRSLHLVLQSIADDMPEDFYSIDLMNAYEELGNIIGESVEDDLVNEIFSKFCMGK